MTMQMATKNFKEATNEAINTLLAQTVSLSDMDDEAFAAMKMMNKLIKASMDLLDAQAEAFDSIDEKLDKLMANKEKGSY